jgi:hypothetical protein
MKKKNLEIITVIRTRPEVCFIEISLKMSEHFSYKNEERIAKAIQFSADFDSNMALIFMLKDWFNRKKHVTS